MRLMRTPATTGPSSSEARLAAWVSAFASVTRCSSSPKSSGSITFCAANEGAVKAPSAKAIASSSGNESAFAQFSSGMSTISGARAASQTIIVRRAPRPPSSREPWERQEPHSDHLGGHDEAHPSRGARGREHEPRQRDPGHLRAGRRDDLRGDERTQRAAPEDAGDVHARSSSRIRGIGEARRNTTPSRQPRTATHRVGRSPIAAPSTPPRSAPNGLVP